MPQVVPPPQNDDEVALQRFYRSAGTPTTQFDGIAPTGALCIDTTGGVLFINTNTKASPTWTVVGDQTSA